MFALHRHSHPLNMVNFRREEIISRLNHRSLDRERFARFNFYRLIKQCVVYYSTAIVASTLFSYRSEWTIFVWSECTLQETPMMCRAEIVVRDIVASVSACLSDRLDVKVCSMVRISR